MDLEEADFDECSYQEEQSRILNIKCREYFEMKKAVQDAGFENEDYQPSETDEEYEEEQKMIRAEEEMVYLAAMENEGTLGEPCIFVSLWYVLIMW